MFVTENDKVIVSELLFYIQNRIKSIAKDVLVTICAKSFSPEVIKSEKGKFFDAVNVRATERRKGPEQVLKNLHDIIDKLLELDNHGSVIPTFVAKDMSSLPKNNDAGVDNQASFEVILKSMSDINNSISSIQAEMITKKTLESALHRQSQPPSKRPAIFLTASSPPSSPSSNSFLSAPPTSAFLPKTPPSAPLRIPNQCPPASFSTAALPFHLTTSGLPLTPTALTPRSRRLLPPSKSTSLPAAPAPVMTVFSAPFSHPSISSTSLCSASLYAPPVSSALLSSAPASWAPVSLAPLSPTSVSSTLLSSTSISSTSLSSPPVSLTPVSAASFSASTVSAASIPTASVPTALVPTASVPAASVSAASGHATLVHATSVHEASFSAAPISPAPVPLALIPPASVPPTSVPPASVPPASVYPASFAAAAASFTASSLPVAPVSSTPVSSTSISLAPFSLAPFSFAPTSSAPVSSATTWPDSASADYTAAGRPGRGRNLAASGRPTPKTIPNPRSSSQNRRQTDLVVGRKVVAGLVSCRGADLTTSVYIGHFDSSSTANGVEALIKEQGVGIVELEPLHQTHQRFKSFRLCIRKVDMTKILNPDFWPEGVVVRRFWRGKTPP